jgi:hypothetical protein
MAGHAHHFVIEPRGGVGPIRFGMHKSEVSNAFTYVYKSFFKASTSKVRSDDCEVVGLIIHYDDDGRVNYIEIYKPRFGVVTLELFGQDISGISVRDAFELLAAHSANHTKNVYGYDFPDLGINTYNNDLESEVQSVECFGVGAKSASCPPTT